MVDLALATTEQILEELGRRPVKFVHVSLFCKGSAPQDGYVAYSQNLTDEEAMFMLRKAEEFLKEPEAKEARDGLGDED